MSPRMHYEPVDIENMDHWAIRVVVREGRWMPLSKPELVVAAKLCRIKGIPISETAERLRITTHQVGKYWRVPAPVDMDRFGPDMIGEIWPPKFTYGEVLKKQRRKDHDEAMVS